MAKLSLRIGTLVSEIEVEDAKAARLCRDAWEGAHRDQELTDQQEALDWIVDMLAKTIARAAGRKAHREQMEAMRELRRQRRESEIEKFE
jgi:hypothetical protein